MDHMQIVRQAFGMVRNHKVLWQLALLIALGGLVIGIFNYFFQLRLQSSMMAPSGSPEQMATQIGGGLLLNCLTFLLFLTNTIVGLAVQGGIVHAVDRIDEGERTTFSGAFRAGWAKVWRLLGVLLLLYAPFFFFVFVGTFSVTFATLSLGNDETGVLLACLLGLVCVVLFLGIFISFIYPFAMRGVVIRGMGIREAMGHGWAVLRANLGNILILALIFFVVYLLIYGIGFVIALPFMSGMVSSVFDPASIDPQQFMNSFYWALLPFSIVGSLISVFLIPWQSATFTLAYKQFTGMGPIEKAAEPSWVA